MSVALPHPAAARVRKRRVLGIGAGIASVFLSLLAIGVVPRVRGSRALVLAADGVKTAVTAVSVGQPSPAPEAALTLAATTQAIQDAIIYARTTGYLRKRHVDIGDRVQAGQLLAEIE